MRISRQLPGILALLAVCPKAVADEGDWQFNGFGTIGYTQTNKYDDRIPRRNVKQSGVKLEDNGLLMDSRLGFQVKGQLNDHWELVGQVVAREQYANRIEDHIDIAFARYQASNEWQVAIGRQAFDLFFLSDHRNTGYSYDWVRPPTEFYGFMPYDSFDGIKIARGWGDFDNDWHWNLSVGNIKAKFDPFVKAESDQVSTTRAKPIYGTELTWQSGNWQLRSSLALLEFEQALPHEQGLKRFVNDFKGYWPDLENIVNDLTRKSNLRYGSFGVIWQHDEIKVQSELSVIDSDIVGFNGERAYIHVSKRWQDWQPFVTFGYAHDNQKNKYAPPPDDGELLFLNQLYLDVLDVNRSMKHNQTSISLGVRWDVAPQKALKLQCDHFHFDADSGSTHGSKDAQYLKRDTRSWCSVAFDWVF